MSSSCKTAFQNQSMSAVERCINPSSEVIRCRAMNRLRLLCAISSGVGRLITKLSRVRMKVSSLLSVHSGILAPMKPKTEELLYFLLWACEMLARPTFRNLTESFESWAYRNGFDRQLAELERQKLLESRTSA